MASPQLPDPIAGRIAAGSAGLGLVAAVTIAAVSSRLGLNERATGATVLGAIGFIIAFAAPFVAALLAFRFRELETRRAVWLASGILSLALAVLTLFGGLWLLFGPVGVGLVVAWRLARGTEGASSSGRPRLLTAWLILWLAAAIWFVLFFRVTPACWQDAGWVAGSTGAECRTDIMDTGEGLLALAGVVIGLAGLFVLGQRGDASRQAGPDAAPGASLPPTTGPGERGRPPQRLPNSDPP